MEPGTFYRKLRSLNPQLKIWCKDDDSKPAGLYYVKQNEYKEICGVDKGDVPERMIYNLNGTIHKAGWRRTLKILIKKGLVDKRKAEKVFNCSMEARSTPKPTFKTAESTLQDIQLRHF